MELVKTTTIGKTSTLLSSSGQISNASCWRYLPSGQQWNNYNPGATQKSGAVGRPSIQELIVHQLFFDAIQSAQARGIDVVLADTAGAPAKTKPI